MALEQVYKDQVVDKNLVAQDKLSLSSKEVDAANIDNINEDKSKNVTETQFDTWFQKWLSSLTNWTWFLWFLKRHNKDQYNVFAQVDSNDDNKISVSEYNTSKDLLKDKFEDHVKQEFVKSEQEIVQAELNTIDEDKEIALNKVSDNIHDNEIVPFQKQILDWFSVDIQEKAIQAISDPYAYAIAYQESWNREHWSIS